MAFLKAVRILKRTKINSLGIKIQEDSTFFNFVLVQKVVTKNTFNIACSFALIVEREKERERERERESYEFM